MVFMALRKKASVEMSESIKTLFTSYLSISVLMTNPSSCGQVTRSTFDLNNKITRSPKVGVVFPQ